MKKLLLAASWLYGQTAIYLAKVGLWDSKYVEAIDYPNDSESESDHVITDDSTQNFEELSEPNENDNKPAAEIKDDYVYDNLVRIKRTRIEPCDQQVCIIS